MLFWTPHFSFWTPHFVWTPRLKQSLSKNVYEFKSKFIDVLWTATVAGKLIIPTAICNLTFSN